MSGKKILMLTGEFTEEYEIFVFQQGMEAVGHTVHVICPDKKAGDRIKTSLHDFEGDQTYTEKPGHYADINKTFSEVRVEDYDAVYAAGGRGPEYIRTDKRIQDMVRHFHEAGKPIFTICHGVQILMAVPGVLKGRKVAGLGACEPEVVAVGEHSSMSNQQRHMSMAIWYQPRVGLVLQRSCVNVSIYLERRLHTAR